MNIVYRILPGLAFLIIFIACKPESRPAYTHLTGQAQGTTFSIKYLDPEDRNFTGPVDSLFRLIDRSMSLWDSTSLITRINRGATDVIDDPHFAAVLSAAIRIAGQSDGAFDPTLGPLIRTWGFSVKKNLGDPSARTVDSLLEQVGFRKIRMEGDRLVRDIPGMEIDLNGLAQGYTVDLIAGYLKEQGIHDLMVEVGGEVTASGKNERGEPWQIGIDKPIESPEAEERSIQVVVPLSGRALATSGSYRKFRDSGGKKLSHIIDPTTGYPVPHRLVSVSVLAEDAMTADAWATAFMVIGLDRGLPLADSLGLEVYGIELRPDSTLWVRATPGFPQ